MSTNEFRTQLGGYNKEDVNNFIINMDSAHSAQVAELKKQYDDSLAAYTELEGNTNVLKAENRMLKEDNESRAEEEAAKEAELLARAAVAEEEASELSEKLSKAESAFAAERDTMKDEMSSLSSRITELEAALAAEKEKYDELQNRFDAAASDYDSASKDNEALQNEIEALKAENEKLEEENTMLKASLEEAEKQVKSQEDVNNIESDAYKLQMYNKVSTQLSDIIINANKSASDITAQAVAEAEKMREDTTLECEEKLRSCEVSVATTKAETAEEAQYIRERISQTANELLSNVSTDLHGSVENCVREINSCISEMQYELRTLLSKISEHTVDMNDKISYYQSCVSEGIESRLTAMDVKYGITTSVPSSADSEK